MVGIIQQQIPEDLTRDSLMEIIMSCVLVINKLNKFSRKTQKRLEKIIDYRTVKLKNYMDLFIQLYERVSIFLIA